MCLRFGIFYILELMWLCLECFSDLKWFTSQISYIQYLKFDVVVSCMFLGFHLCLRFDIFHILNLILCLACSSYFKWFVSQSQSDTCWFHEMLNVGWPAPLCMSRSIHSAWLKRPNLLHVMMMIGRCLNR